MFVGKVNRVKYKINVFLSVQCTLMDFFQIDVLFF